MCIFELLIMITMTMVQAGVSISDRKMAVFHLTTSALLLPHQEDIKQSIIVLLKHPMEK